MRLIYLGILAVFFIYLACGSDSGKQSFQIPNTIRDSECSVCMLNYLDSFPKMGDDSVLAMFVKTNDLPDDYQPDRMGIPHNREKVTLLIFVKREDTIIKYFYDIERRRFGIYNFRKPGVGIYPPKKIKKKDGWLILNSFDDWNTISEDSHYYSALDTSKLRLGSSNRHLVIDADDTSMVRINDRLTVTHKTKTIRHIKDIFLPLWQYSQRCARNDTNTVGRWYGPGMCCIRIFKQRDKYYELWYWADGTGQYNEVKLEKVDRGIKVIPVYHNSEYENKVLQNYKLIDFNQDYILKYFIGKKEYLDDSFFHEKCYKYCEAETDSMFYYGYDTLSPKYRKDSIIMLLPKEFEKFIPDK